MRTMLVWRRAIRLPTVIVSDGEDPNMSGRTTSCLAEEADEDELQERHEAGGLRRHRQERGDRRGRALVGVGRPGVERHRRHLEGEADDHEDDAERDDRLVADRAVELRADLGRAASSR